MPKFVALFLQAAPKAICCLAQQVKQFDMQLLCVSLQLPPDSYSETVMQVMITVDNLLLCHNQLAQSLCSEFDLD